DNYTLRVIKRELNQRGIVTLRFNFRGVGNSEGTYDEGIGEQKDTLAALAFLSQCQKVERGRIALIGYSFGGMVALSVCKNNPLVKSVAAISPVITPRLLQGNNKPTLLICGDKDEMTPPANIIDNPEKNSPNFFVEIIKGPDHFWAGYIEELSAKVVSFIERHL
ncbi:MAG: alpha/beta fold hydrolase, partial [Firmicutes bacterium]|nr:alpha/beta fold hydrolase [Bacillota bacterium]